MTALLDTKFGTVRSASEINQWEKGVRPQSLVKFDRSVALILCGLTDVVKSPLLRSAATTKSYLWAMDELGDLYIAVEELAIEVRDPFTGQIVFSGYPRRRGYRHASEERKLGHPTLLNCGNARIAGELHFDIKDDNVVLFLNANSGRYCQAQPPSRQQLDNVAQVIRDHGLNVIVDYL